MECPGSGRNKEMFGEDAYTYYNRYGYGPWTLQHPLILLRIIPEEMTAAVSIQDCMGIAGFCGASSDGLLLSSSSVGYELKLSAMKQCRCSHGGWRMQRKYRSPGGTYEAMFRHHGILNPAFPDGYTGVTSTYAEIVVGRQRIMRGA